MHSRSTSAPMARAEILISKSPVRPARSKNPSAATARLRTPPVTTALHHSAHPILTFAGLTSANGSLLLSSNKQPMALRDTSGASSPMAATRCGRATVAPCVPQQAGMVQDVATGREHFMVPGGGNGMIDPRTGQRHELISPRPSRQVRDTAQPVSRNEACAEAKAKLSSAQSNPDRTINTLRAAESKYAAMCGG